MLFHLSCQLYTLPILMIISLYLLNFAQSGKVVHVLYNNVSVERCVFY